MKIYLETSVINFLFAEDAPEKMKITEEFFNIIDEYEVFISDIVLLEELSEEQRNNEELIAGCVGGALLKEDYLDYIKKAGFKVKIILENKEISKTQYQGIALESLTVEGVK